jgi:hypothetical protein
MNTHKLNPALAQKFGSTDLKGAVSVSWSEESEDVLLSTDGSPWIAGAFVDGRHYRVSVTCASAAVAVPAGTTGVLELNIAARANGDGTGTAMKASFDGAVARGSRKQVGTGGIAEVVFEFIVPGKVVGSALSDPLTVS